MARLINLKLLADFFNKIGHIRTLPLYMIASSAGRAGCPAHFRPSAFVVPRLMTVLVSSAGLFIGTGYVVRGHGFRIHDPVKFGRRDIVEL